MHATLLFVLILQAADVESKANEQAAELVELLAARKSTKKFTSGTGRFIGLPEDVPAKKAVAAFRIPGQDPESPMAKSVYLILDAETNTKPTSLVFLTMLQTDKARSVILRADVSGRPLFAHLNRGTIGPDGEVITHSADDDYLDPNHPLVRHWAQQEVQFWTDFVKLPIAVRNNYQALTKAELSALADQTEKLSQAAIPIMPIRTLKDFVRQHGVSTVLPTNVVSKLSLSGASAKTLNLSRDDASDGARHQIFVLESAELPLIVGHEDRRATTNGPDYWIRADDNGKALATCGSDPLYNVVVTPSTEASLEYELTIWSDFVARQKKTLFEARRTSE